MHARPAGVGIVNTMIITGRVNVRLRSARSFNWPVKNNFEPKKKINCGENKLRPPMKMWKFFLDMVVQKN